MFRNVVGILLGLSVLGAAAGLVSCGESDDAGSSRRVLVLGMDGLEPTLLGEMMEAGKLPNFVKLKQKGGLAKLGTSTPPQSPVAWSDFITGNDATVHGIFDFVHRNPETMVPKLSTGGPEEGLLRLGTPFWRYLVERGVDTTIFRVPSNYPPDDPGSKHYRCLAGMGTPDLHGTYGEFSLFTVKASRPRRQVSGGWFCRLRQKGNVAEGMLTGPEKPELPRWVPRWFTESGSGTKQKDLEIPFQVVRDPENKVARISICDQTLLMKEGEWGEWCRVEFPVLQVKGFAIMKVAGIVRFMLLKTHPTMELYASPINIDPEDPVNPISVPGSYAQEVSRETGRYYTQGIPEDHSALSAGALTDDQYLVQARTVMDERAAQLEFALKRFKQGFLFFYFGASDQVAHMFWRDLDERHPTYKKELKDKYGDVIGDIYVQMDRALGRAMESLRPNDTLIVMSDHGFGSFRRGFNLNSWLKDNGYLSVPDKDSFDPEAEMFQGVDWRSTKAYGLGINLLYVNLQGREKEGSVPAVQYDGLLNELKGKLLGIKDPDTGERVIAEVYRVDELYPGVHQDPKIKDRAPDLIIGYGAGYRAGWKTILGSMPKSLVVDNLDRWSGDHCVATDLVPGVILANKAIRKPNPTLRDLGPTILAEFGIETPASMKGRPIF
jgi:predicted AlkP superfamily phosphohydrolase/phosphomutase